MPSQILFLNSTVAAFNATSSLDNGATWESPPGVSWASDDYAPAPNWAQTFLEMNRRFDGLYADTGVVRFGLEMPTGLASGEAWEPTGFYCYVSVIQGGGWGGLRLAHTGNGAVEYYQTWGAAGPVTPSYKVPGTGSSDWRTIPGMQALIDASVPFGNAIASRVTGCYMVVQTYPRPAISVTQIAAPITTTTRPTIAWTSSWVLPQGGFRVRVFTAAQYGIGGFDPETSPNTYDSGVVASSSKSITLPALANGTYRAYVQAYQVLPKSGFTHWTTDSTTLAALGATQYTPFTINTAPPPAPTAITPSSGSTVNTDLPTLGATLGASTVTGATVKAEWQLATDAGFTTGLRTITEPDSKLRSSGATTEAILAANQLSQGTWFIRAREVDSLGVAGAWSANHSFTVSHPPTSFGHSPTGAASRLDADAAANRQVTMSWTFSDTSPVDSQSAHQIIVERDSDGLVVLDTGKQVNAGNWASVTIADAYEDVLLRWRVRLWDSDDAAGPYSANQQFYLRDRPEVTVTAPVDIAETPTPTVTWDFTASGGRTQAQYRVSIIQYFDFNNVWLRYDTGWLNGDASTHLVAEPVLELGNDYFATVHVKDSAGLDNSNSSDLFEAQWTPAETPTVTLDATGFDTLGYIQATWPANRDPGFISYKVYRREVGATAWQLAGTITDTSADPYVFHDYLAPSGVPLEYAVTHVAYRFGTPVESAPEAVGPATGVNSHYWLIAEGQPELNVRLSNVVADSFSEVWEQGEIPLLGRGRRVERGTRWGYQGTLEARVRDTDYGTGREMRERLEGLRAGSVAVWLRNPFGSVWRVVLGDLEIEREPGVGAFEWFSVSIPYSQVS